MSSLLQHHGCTTTHRRGYVELLLYLQHQVESPVACGNCGAVVEFPLERFHVCPCGSAIGYVFFYDADGAGTSWCLYEHWPAGLPASSYAHASNRWTEHDTEPVSVVRRNGKTVTVPKLYRIWRKPVGMLGCWAQFRWDNQVHSPDLSVPIVVHKLPRDAEPLTDEEATAYWRS